jgi:hypothetical protein
MSRLFARPAVLFPSLKRQRSPTLKRPRSPSLKRQRRGLLPSLTLQALVVALLATGGLHGQPPDARWEANADLENPTIRTVEGLGAMQGVSFHDDKVYLYGDVWNANPRVGVIREYTADYQRRGR